MLTKGLLGTKVGMTRVFLEGGDSIACTLVEAGPCTVVQRKTAEKDGYDAIQIGFGARREKLLSKAVRGHLKKAGVETARHLGEVRLPKGAAEPAAVGAKIACDVFQPGDFVDVIGTMKGRGFSGVVRRHHFATMHESHGNHFFQRHAGSIGSRKPQHTLRGTRMAGHYGASRITVQNLEILRVDADKNLLYVKGAVPGPNGGLLKIRQAKKRPPKAK
jgi:large subunit ribosomal protein L3